jgi:hypothetical protein
VVIPLATSSWMMLQRNLLCTRRHPRQETHHPGRIPPRPGPGHPHPRSRPPPHRAHPPAPPRRDGPADPGARQQARAPLTDASVNGLPAQTGRSTQAAPDTG